MASAHFSKVEELFFSALDKGSEEKISFLDSACSGDHLLRREVEELLAAYKPAQSFIGTLPLNLAATMIENAGADPRIGQKIGHYQLEKQIGTGGMGEVYLATDLVAGRKAAVKLLPARFTGNVERARRFEREARAVVALNHPNIITVYEIGQQDSTHYIASELIEGETLRQRLGRGPLEVKEAVEVALQVATALQAAYQAGIVHRDIKPENIMLRRDGYVKVLDFGLAKLAEPDLSPAMDQQDGGVLQETDISCFAGTARYMSPEQALGVVTDQRTDIWSLGVVLFEMLSRQTPFDGKDLRAITRAITEAEVPPLPGCPTELEPLIHRALEKQPDKRYQSARDLNDALKVVRRRIDWRAEGLAASSGRRASRSRVTAALAAAAAIMATVTFYWWPMAKWSAAPEKSIAVLPFQDLSGEKEKSYFTAGVQDEILTDLSRIADLKVISRTSSLTYSATTRRDSREIGQQLGVAHLLEGSVQRSGNRIRIQVQLIDTRTDAHLWADTYVRDLADVFAVQSEIAQTIANQLRAKISAGEKAAITRTSTTDLIANDLYLRAMKFQSLASEEDDLPKRITLLEQAIVRDPHFVRAYCDLARLHLRLYDDWDHTQPRLHKAETNIARAAALEPGSGNVHLIRAHYLARAIGDYDDARAELELARRALPNDSGVYYEMALVDRRQGRWPEALRNFDRAIELDPHNFQILIDGAVSYSMAQRFPEANRLAQRIMTLAPHDHEVRLFVAQQRLAERADIRPLLEETEAILAADPGAGRTIFGYLWACALFRHDPAETDRVIALVPPEGFRQYKGGILPREWFVGYAARVLNQAEPARAAFLTARTVVEKHLSRHADDAITWSLLGKINALLGEKEKALEASRQACQLLPLSREPVWGLCVLREQALIHAWVGEKEIAMQKLVAHAGEPAFVNYGELKLDPDWDSLRGDPRFDKIVASLAPKNAASR